MPRAARRRVLSMCCAAAACLSVPTLRAQDASTAPASIPAGIQPAENTAAAKPPKPAPEKQAREADDAYLAGAKAMQRKDFAAAEQSFGRAVQLNPSREEYLRALSMAREDRVQDLVAQAATAHRAGNVTLADSLLAQARILAPDSRVVTQHFDVAPPLPSALLAPATADEDGLPGTRVPTFGDPIVLKPTAGLHSFHRTASVEEQLRAVFAAYGIKTQFPTPLGAGRTLRFDLDDADFATASRVIQKIANSFVVPVQPDLALLIPNTQEARDQYLPLMEETIYMPGLSGEAMTELANVARQVFDLKQVNASQTQGNMLVRGDAQSLRLLNATYADMLSGMSDVQIDVSVYEVDKTRIRNLGITTPTSVGAFSVLAQAQSIVSQNQSAISALVSSGQITLTGNYFEDIATEAFALLASGAVSSSQFSSLLGTLGTFGSYVNAAGKTVGVPLAGLYLGSGSTINLALNSTDVRTLDFAQLRASDHQAATFRAGTRYPVITGNYTTSSALSSSLTGLTAAQQALVSQYLGNATTTSVPQFQYEDLGLSLKATPTVHPGGSVTLVLDMKIEALGGTSINQVPILNSRALTSTVTVPSGQTVLLASEVNNSEMRSISGLPGLGDIPGFGGTDHDTEKDTSEILITLTPHIVRLGHRDTSSKRLAINNAAGVQ